GPGVVIKGVVRPGAADAQLHATAFRCRYRGRRDGLGRGARCALQEDLHVGTPVANAEEVPVAFVLECRESRLDLGQAAHELGAGVEVLVLLTPCDEARMALVGEPGLFGSDE